MDATVRDVAVRAVAETTPGPVYQRLADALAAVVERPMAPTLPSARRLAAEIGINRATATAAYRELARRGLLELRRGRRETIAPGLPSQPPGEAERREPALDLARYAPDRELLPTGAVFAWLGLGEGEGEAVAQYGDPRGYPALRAWLRARLAGQGVVLADDQLLLTSGVQHALDLLLRATTQPGDVIAVEDPTYPGLPPLLPVHELRAAALPVGREGLDPEAAAAVLTHRKPRLAVLTPTLQNPTGSVLPRQARELCLEAAAAAGSLLVEEHFDPGLVTTGSVPPPLAALSPQAVLVGSFSKALFPGLRVGWLAGPRALVRQVTEIKLATDLSGSTFLEAAAWQLCRRGLLDRQLARLRAAAVERTAVVVQALEERAPENVRWSQPAGGFSMLLELGPGRSSQETAARAAAAGVWVLPGPAVSVSGRDDIMRLAFAAVGGGALRSGVERLVEALREREGAFALV